MKERAKKDRDRIKIKSTVLKWRLPLRMLIILLFLLFLLFRHLLLFLHLFFLLPVVLHYCCCCCVGSQGATDGATHDVAAGSVRAFAGDTGQETA